MAVLMCFVWKGPAAGAACEQQTVHVVVKARELTEETKELAGEIDRVEVGLYRRHGDAPDDFAPIHEAGVDFLNGGELDLKCEGAALDFKKMRMKMTRNDGSVYFNIVIYAKSPKAQGIGVPHLVYLRLHSASNETIVVRYSIQKNPVLKKIPIFPISIDEFVETYVELDKALSDVEVAESQPIRVAPGAVERKTREHTVKHTVEVKQGWKLEPQVQLNWAVISTSIKGQIERSMRRSFGQLTTTTREVDVKGGNRPLKLIWVERHVTGKAVTFINFRRYEIRFRFPTGWDLRCREADDRKEFGIRTFYLTCLSCSHMSYSHMLVAATTCYSPVLLYSTDLDGLRRGQSLCRLQRLGDASDQVRLRPSHR